MSQTEHTTFTATPMATASTSSSTLQPSNGFTSSSLNIRNRITKNAISVFDLLSMSGADDDDGV
ncbi:hypothetical protein SAMD00019534_105500 [Acytostelium subglobosum LB1]|uniref:hypothetical protein n=1 Tax=Acytostelium subglobosum LB1 TaxID=1410327 RepID=UPI0006449D9E|nr:hypothetical protein SAMD00019534_105500 [Acytostelium subglobosum LB1]GAM27375.1 hypothetical protein SAMD00019534_105500 [Acytostelium subglobosum LB1]|eukprot:XP_012749842.1 hypothetical protein SAMD00019534_105500 [Acytostelium subglobosum LB1]